MATTALMPLDPAVSPQQISRVLTIRANLLPDEITAGRNTRRLRILMIGAVVIVVALLVAWYAYAVQQKQLADQDLADVTEQVSVERNNQKKYQPLTQTINQKETIDKQLKALLANDLSWAALLDSVRATGDSAEVKITSISGTLAAEKTGATNADALPSTSGATTIASLTISGTAPDKKTIANYIVALGEVDNLANPYLTTATQSETGVTFTLNADVTATALCGRFTTPCKTGGK
jgi:Tfp pilus assembly protein PilN